MILKYSGKNDLKNVKNIKKINMYVKAIIKNPFNTNSHSLGASYLNVFEQFSHALAFIIMCAWETPALKSNQTLRLNALLSTENTKLK